MFSTAVFVQESPFLTDLSGTTLNAGSDICLRASSLRMVFDQLFQEFVTAFDLADFHVLVDRQRELRADQGFEEVRKGIGSTRFFRRVEGDLVPADLDFHFQPFDLLLDGPAAVFVLLHRIPAQKESHLLVLGDVLPHDFHFLSGISDHFLIEGLALLEFPLEIDGGLTPSARDQKCQKRNHSQPTAAQHDSFLQKTTRTRNRHNNLGKAPSGAFPILYLNPQDKQENLASRLCTPCPLIRKLSLFGSV